MAALFRRIGIVREGKIPNDRRVALTPSQCATALKRFPLVDLVVQRSKDRAFTDSEYEDAGIILVDDLRDRELLIGIKEVPVDMLLDGKSYLFFSHTTKKQPHNQGLMRAVINKGITLMDHELLTDEHGDRVLAFGYWAGVVGAYNAFRAWQLTHGGPLLKPAHACHDLEELEGQLLKYPLPSDLHIVLTGGGRVGKGAMGVLERAGVTRITPEAFLHERSVGPCYTVLGTRDLYERTDGGPFDKSAFHADPTGHRAKFLPYLRKAQMYLACHFWDPRGPKILSTADLRDPGRVLEVIADISCDVNGPIDSTLRASSIDDPFYGYDPETAQETKAGVQGSITVMAVDNLPCELPRDASEAFGNDLMGRVLPCLVENDPKGMIDRATIVRKGELTPRFDHLRNYAGV